MTSTRRIVPSLLALGLATALAGCGTDEEPSGASSPTAGIESAVTEGGSSPSDDETPADPSGSPLGQALAAVALAESETGGTAYALDREDGGWQIDVAVDDRQVEVRTDQTGGEVLDSREDDRLDDDDRAELQAATVTLGGALEAAAAEVAGEIEDADLDEDGGTLVWQVSIRADGTEQEIHIDAKSGEVLRVDTD
ncbi:PepSY domain-containing protein [Nocardioides massiliensis]|uniref:Membrane protein YkoI n=1 Tax=Nocardioides massiliensis TaxID=1325935 RepID=A0ABT9NQ11_9ACTN|nr:PepSY domain-containing protein [Nocardioides massiliensis]MDP9822521.1 putative membrane protein YkoI [Nocardioides massiliensis]